MNQEQINQLIKLGAEWGFRVIAALLIFFIGRWVAKVLTRTTRRLMQSRQLDAALVSFVSSLLYALLLIFVILAAVAKLGIQTTSLVAVLGAAGLAVGLALQGSLSNFAAGVLIILFRPFRIGDFIEAGGTAGIVDEIGILFTEMRTPDNKKIVAPNSTIMAGVITNVTANDTRRCDMTFGVSYSDDLGKVRSILQEMIAADPRVLPEPAPQIVIAELGASSVNFAVRPWLKKDDFWDFFFEMQLAVKQRFDREGISIPFPQQNVHLIHHQAVKMQDSAGNADSWK